ncbi:pectin lyase [Diplocarpon mali]|nr:pectin lyase [Diplocarpon mali]
MKDEHDDATNNHGGPDLAGFHSDGSRTHFNTGSPDGMRPVKTARRVTPQLCSSITRLAVVTRSTLRRHSFNTPSSLVQYSIVTRSTLRRRLFNTSSPRSTIALVRPSITPSLSISPASPFELRMRYSSVILASLGSLAGQCGAVGVVGTAPGFAAGTTGGGSATPQYPADIDQLKTWLTDATARVIVLDREYNFIGSEGTVSEMGCRPASNKCGDTGQDAINGANWCKNGNAGPGSSEIPVTYDKAGFSAINVGSNKSIIGIGSAAVIRGKGLRMANNAKNVIIQNIHITEINPQYIWGGDAIITAGADLVWVDHCKISLVGRQMFVANAAPNRVTISNTEFDGNTPWSATCNNQHYWAILLNGPDDRVTMQGNYIHHTSGRAPKIGGTALLHAVNNYWYAVDGHAFDNAVKGQVVAEGNAFQDVKTTLNANAGQMFTSPSASANTACAADLGHNCQLNSFSNSGPLPGSDTSFLVNFKGQNVAPADAASNGAANTAGVGKI